LNSQRGCVSCSLSPEDYFPPPEAEGGWRVTEPGKLGVNAELLKQAVSYHNEHSVTKSYGGALIIIHRGHVVAESYVTGDVGGPKPWLKGTCNDIKSSTKSVFGTTVGVFLDEYRHSVNLETPLVGANREGSLIPQIWDQPLTDERKTRIRVKHVLSMTSGHDSREPWLAPSRRRHTAGHVGPYQMYEYCLGWWGFDGVPAQRKLLFEPGQGFNYSNFGLEQMALAMRNISGVEVGRYAWDRFLRDIGMPKELGEGFYREMPYVDDREMNFSDHPGWGVGGSIGCNAYGADRSSSPIGHNTIASSTFRCSARDLARIGYLWLRRGKWGKRQLVPEAWIKQATTRFRRDDGTTPVNYGYTFWLQDEWGGVPADTFGSRGHNINDCYVIPSLDLVVARLGNDNPPREQRDAFVSDLLTGIARAVT
jgi:CubicO group peptidase (beta-lactamase class C family)